MSSCGVVTVFLDSNRNFTKTVTKTINNLNFYFKLEMLKQRKKEDRKYHTLKYTQFLCVTYNELCKCF